MGLGPDNSIAKHEFIEAMRARLEAKEAGLGANVDDPEVKLNLGALGKAVYLIATVHAETRSDSFTDSEFWQWVEEVNDWLISLRAWQQDIDIAFNNWTPTAVAEQNLKNALVAIDDPGFPPASFPASIRGKIE